MSKEIKIHVQEILNGYLLIHESGNKEYFRNKRELIERIEQGVSNFDL